MNPNFWSLLYVPTSEEKTFAQWGISPDAQRNIQSQSVDTFTFTIISGEIDSEPTFSPNESCVIKRNGVGYFYGRVTGITMSATPNSESLHYTLSGLWWYMDQLVFQQPWNVASDPTLVAPTLEAMLRPRTILFVKIDGIVSTPISVSEQVTKAVQYCIDAGAPFAIGTIDPGDFKPQANEVKDMTCGEIVRNCLHWTPNCVSWFDYSTSPPTLNIRPRSALTSKSVPVSNAPTNGLSITPRYDLVVSGVKIVYESQNSINEFTWKKIVADTAGDPDGFQAVVCSTEIGGLSATIQNQKLSIASVNFTLKPFWDSVLPWLKQASDVTIENVRLNNTLVLGQTADAADATSNYDKIGRKDFATTELTWDGDPPTPVATQNVLSDGQVPHWLEDDFMDVVATAKISFTLENPETKAKERKVKQPFYAKVKLTQTLAAGANQPFQNVTSLTPAEPTPEGVAAAYYAATSVLHYEGSYERTEDEVGGNIGPGCVLNITGARADWETMNAIVQSVMENLGNGLTSIKFGPPSHLSTQEFIELVRVMRNRFPSRRLQEQVDGKSYGNGAQVEGAIQVPQGASNISVGHTMAKTVSTYDPGTGEKSQIIFETGP